MKQWRPGGGSKCNDTEDSCSLKPKEGEEDGIHRPTWSTNTGLCNYNFHLLMSTHDSDLPERVSVSRPSDETISLKVILVARLAEG